MIKKYRSKVVEKEAILFDGENYSEVFEFMEDNGKSEYSRNFRDNIIRVHTLEGTMIADKGDYIIKGLGGEFYPCKPDIFNQSYSEIKGV